MSIPVQYQFQVDLTIGGSTPYYQVISGSFHLPANTMPPLLQPEDTIQFSFLARAVENVMLYARPLEPSEEPAPFENDQWEMPLSNGTTLTIGPRKGYWSFTIAGIYIANIAPQYPRVPMPFLVDPEVKVGSGVKPS